MSLDLSSSGCTPESPVHPEIQKAAPVAASPPAAPAGVAPPPASPERAAKNLFSYYDSLSAADRRLFEIARKMQGLDDEIALLRLIIARLYQNDPVNQGPLFRAITLLAELLRIKHHIKDPGNGKLGESIAGIMRDIGVPLGMVEEETPGRFKWAGFMEGRNEFRSPDQCQS